MKKRLSLILVLVVILAGCSFLKGTDSSKTPMPFIVGYTNMSDTDVFCVNIKKAFDAKINGDPNFIVQYTDANYNINRQLEQIETFITKKVNIIIINAVDYEGVVPGIKKANAAGIPVIALNVRANGGDYTFIGSKNYDSGRMQGQYMKEKLPPNAKILYLQGTRGLYHSIERLQGFIDACITKRPDVTILASSDGEYERAKAMKITEEWIKKFPKFDAIVSANDQMALGALQALKNADRLAGVVISGTDGTKEMCNAIKMGEVAHSIYQDDIGQAEKTYEVVKMITKGERPPRDIILPFKSITKENVDDFLE